MCSNRWQQVGLKSEEVSIAVEKLLLPLQQRDNLALLLPRVIVS